MSEIAVIFVYDKFSLTQESTYTQTLLWNPVDLWIWINGIGDTESFGCFQVSPSGLKEA